jgi:hypothetical protein
MTQIIEAVENSQFKFHKTHQIKTKRFISKPFVVMQLWQMLSKQKLFQDDNSGYTAFQLSA